MLAAGAVWLIPSRPALVIIALVAPALSSLNSKASPTVSELHTLQLPWPEFSSSRAFELIALEMVKVALSWPEPDIVVPDDVTRILSVNALIAPMPVENIN